VVLTTGVAAAAVTVIGADPEALLYAEALAEFGV
jgi:hypothetical protein